MTDSHYLYFTMLVLTEVQKIDFQSFCYYIDMIMIL